MKTKKIALLLSILTGAIFAISIAIDSAIGKGISYFLICVSIASWLWYLILRKKVSVVTIEENTISQPEPQTIPPIKYYEYDEQQIGTGKDLTFECDIAWVQFKSKPRYSYSCEVREVFSSSWLNTDGLIIQFEVAQTHINNRCIKTLRKEEKSNQIAYDCNFSKKEWPNESLNRTFRIKVFEKELQSKKAE